MKKEMRSARWLVVALTLGLLPSAVAAEAHQATGFKVVNVTSAAAEIWTRVTLREAANPADGPLPRVEAFEVKRGERIAQLVIQAVEHVAFVEVTELDETERGDGGFGHTGK
jgi:hypothetical protein